LLFLDVMASGSEIFGSLGVRGVARVWGDAVDVSSVVLMALRRSIDGIR
jgi:hypothetical protein